MISPNSILDSMVALSVSIKLLSVAPAEVVVDSEVAVVVVEGKSSPLHQCRLNQY